MFDNLEVTSVSVYNALVLDIRDMATCDALKRLPGSSGWGCAAPDSLMLTWFVFHANVKL